ncbi:hypothetical protein LOTGIDRAFT_155141 [Lottia gigantea]|uniref:DNA-directed DNA polymerase n=1 Tax=Lottia gigantea TaxID=225164 RepID=V4B9L0_LOTGI|nr:hypothetical protein LOTGIDRAFT_155141 [Lottia gigantea]ESO85649.1 hypothetical protein LOTGIDRAFT_155141 [Lottia gigantea]
MMMESSINSATILPPYEEEFETVDNLHWPPETANSIYLFWIHQLQASKYSVNPKDKTEVHAKLIELDYSKLMAFDANGLYASAMTEGEYPKAESARAFLPEEEKEFVKLFNKQKFRPRTAILKVWFEYPTNMFFQPIPAKDKITFTNSIVIPNEKQKKVFRSYLNLVKRKAPNSEGIMYPYNDGKELNIDENYEFDDFDYLTIQEENEEC